MTETLQLLELSELIAQIEANDDLRRLIEDKVKPLFDCDGCDLFVVSSDKKTYSKLITLLPAAPRIDERAEAGIASVLAKLSYSGSAIEWMMAQMKEAGKPMLFDYEELSERFPTDLAEPDYRECLAANLVVRGATIGVFCLNSRHKNFFQSPMFPLFQSVGRLISVALANISARDEAARLVEEQRARAEQLAQSNEALARTSARLVQQPELPAFLHQVVLEMVTQLNADAGHYALFDQENDTLQTFAHFQVGESTSEAGMGEVRPAREARCWQILKRLRRPHYFNLENEADLFWRLAIDYHREQGHKSVWGVPLFVGDEPLGHFGFAFKGNDPVSLQQLEVVTALAHQAVLAIQMTRLGEETKKVAVVGAQQRSDQEHKMELVRANDALRRGAERLRMASSVEAVLESFLLEAIAVSGASHGIILELVRGTEFISRYWANATMESVWSFPDEPLDPTHIDAMNRDDLGYMRRIAEGEVVPIAVDERLESWHPTAFHRHREAGNSIGWHFPYRVAGQIKGCLSLSFSKEAAPVPGETTMVFVTALVLALQASLALQALHMVEESNYKAQEAAIMEERNRMAREIHDTLAQSFTGVATHLEAARALVPPDSKAQFHIEQARNAAREGLQEARRSVRALRPHSLEGSDLCAALQKMVANCDHSGLPQVGFSIEGESFPLSAEVEDDLLRVGQEALINAVRHSHAQQVAVELVFLPDEVLLRVRDDGQGFDPNSGQELSGFGLVGIRERIGHMNGQFRLNSAPGKGTELVVIVPGSPKKHD